MTLRPCSLLFLLTLLIHAPLRAASSDAQLEVWGLAYRNLVAYPEHQLGARELVDTLVQARRDYPLEMSLEQLASVADAATRLYRQRGYKFHSVYVPPQKPRHGLVEFAVVEAVLGDVHVRGKNIDKKAVSALFTGLLQKPLYQPDVDRVIMALKAQSGLDAIAYYSRGSRPGEVRLNIKATGTGITPALQADNYGTDSTGENRLIASVSASPLPAKLDQLSVGVIATDGDHTNLYGYLNYRLPLWNLDNQLLISLSQNRFQLGREFDPLGLSGDANTYELALRHSFARSWSGQQDLLLSLARKDADYDSPLGMLIADERADSATLGWLWRDAGAAGRWQLGASVRAGEQQLEGSAKRDYSALLVNASWRSQWGESGRAFSGILSARLQAQYSDDAQASFDKLSLSGVSASRAFAPGFFASDRGALASLEWYLPWLIGGDELQLTPFVFADAGYGEKLNFNRELFERALLISLGAGFEFNWGDYWYLQVLAAQDLDQDSKSGLEAEAAKAFLRLNFRY